MALGLTPEHLELAAAVRGWSQRHCPESVVGAIADATDGGAERYRADLVPALAELGLFGLHLPEADGGQGFGLPELAIAVEELGRALLPGAFLPTVLASAVLAEVTAENRTALASDSTVTKLIAQRAADRRAVLRDVRRGRRGRCWSWVGIEQERRAERRALGAANARGQGGNDRRRYDRHSAQHRRRADARPAARP